MKNKLNKQQINKLNKSESYYRSSDKNINSSDERYKSLTETSPDGIITINTKGTITSVNHAFLELTGYFREEIIGKHFTKISTVKLSKIPEYLKIFYAIMRGKTPPRIKYSCKRKDGDIHWVDAKFGVIKKKGKILEILGILRDITDERKAEEALKASLEKYANLIKSSPIGIITIDTKGKITSCNKRVLDLTGYKRKEFVGENFTRFKILKVKEIARLLKMLVQAIKGRKIQKFEISWQHKNGTLYIGEARYSSIKEKGKITGFQMIVMDITERKEAEKKLKYLSFHDKLTGLYNRSYIEEEIARLDTERQLPLSIAMGDVNALKLINDAFGYRNGDKLLVKVGKILKKCYRKEDIIARWGGDEFLVLLPKTSEEDAVKLLDRVREACGRTTDQKIPASVSIGISTKTIKAQNIQDIIKEAEDRMYQHKLTESKSIHSSIISSLKATLWERSHETEEHGRRLKELSLKLGRVAELAPNELDELALLSTLHDMGKIGIEDSILAKPGKLTKKEWEVMKRHPEIGYKIAQSSPQLLQIADGILYHHEWWDGTGYPHGLTGENIPLISRIIAIADAYDVMTHNRVYKKAVTKKEAIKEVKRYSGTQFDPGLVKKFIKIVSV